MGEIDNLHDPKTKAEAYGNTTVNPSDQNPINDACKYTSTGLLFLLFDDFLICFGYPLPALQERGDKAPPFPDYRCYNHFQPGLGQTAL